MPSVASPVLSCLPAFVDEEFAFVPKSGECGDDIGVIVEGSRRKKIATASVSAWETCDAIATACVETENNFWSQEDVKDLLVDPTTLTTRLSSRKRKCNADQQREYIYVRARRGQATDRHSLAERARRKELRSRMMLLRSIVPGCDQITGQAAVLDVIINFIQSLQRQVEALSLKCSLVTVSTPKRP